MLGFRGRTGKERLVYQQETKWVQGTCPEMLALLSTALLAIHGQVADTAHMECIFKYISLHFTLSHACS